MRYLLPLLLVACTFPPPTSSALMSEPPAPDPPPMAAAPSPALSQELAVVDAGMTDDMPDPADLSVPAPPDLGAGVYAIYCALKGPTCTAPGYPAAPLAEATWTGSTPTWLAEGWPDTQESVDTFYGYRCYGSDCLRY